MPTPVETFEALAEVLTAGDIEAMAPARRQRLQQRLQLLEALMDDTDKPAPRSGVLVLLKRGDRAP
jgi:hypothetical protein